LSKIKNILRWITVLWKDRDWDYWFTFEILKTKLKFQAQYIRKYGYHVSSEYDAERMELCVKLIDRVQNEYYFDQLVERNRGEFTDKEIKKAADKHDKAKRILFKLLEYNIEKWWD
jgi:hypothetical protein